MDWDPDFADRSPMFEPLRALAARFRGCADWPCPADIQRVFDECTIHTATGFPLRLVEPLSAGGHYEQGIGERAQMPYRRRDWHDFFNALAWIVYPQTKAALNAAHCEALNREAEQRAGLKPHARSRMRDALTLFDESGAIVVSDDPELLEDLRDFQWKRLFSERRARVRASMRVFVFGHGLLEKALRPYVGMAAHALLIPIDREFMQTQQVRQPGRIDELTAARIAALDVPQALSPLPLLGMPGWWPGNESASFYDNEAYFRPRRKRR